MATATLTDTESFIEAHFPVSKVSKESYKERKANHSQTLTGLGKWWGRKPLVMIRAAIIGLLMPPSENPKRDREIFLKIMTMDEDGLWKRMREADGISERKIEQKIMETLRQFRATVERQEAG